MNKHDPIRVLVVDDHFVVRLGLTTLVNTEADMVMVAEAETGRQAVELFRRHRPDITLMDLRLPDMDGVQAITEIIREFPEARIIVLTTYSGDVDIYKALEAGARAYLLKEGLGDEMLEAVRLVRQGKRYIPRAVAARLAQCQPSPGLTSRELEILRMLATGKSNKEIAHDLSVAEGTVRNHISSILSKLGVGDRTQAVAVALQRGIIYLDMSLRQSGM